jgi:GNAT superfamily N-acetyltransferase
MTLTIRHASPEDLNALHPLVACFTAERGEPVPTPDDLMRRAFVAPGARVLIAREDGHAIGYALMLLDTDTGRAGFTVAQLYVTETRRRCGVGRRLIAAARALTEAEGRVRLTVRNLPGARGQVIRLGEGGVPVALSA